MIQNLEQLGLQYWYHGFVQLHNKETGKGFVLLASEIILIPSFLVFENLRSSLILVSLWKLKILRS